MLTERTTSKSEGDTDMKEKKWHEVWMVERMISMPGSSVLTAPYFITSGDCDMC